MFIGAGALRADKAFARRAAVAALAGRVGPGVRILVSGHRFAAATTRLRAGALATKAAFAALAIGRLLTLLAGLALLTLLASRLLALLVSRLLALLAGRLLVVVAAGFTELFVFPFFSHREILLSEAPL